MYVGYACSANQQTWRVTNHALVHNKQMHNLTVLYYEDTVASFYPLTFNTLVIPLSLAYRYYGLNHTTHMAMVAKRSRAVHTSTSRVLAKEVKRGALLLHCFLIWPFKTPNRYTCRTGD